MKFILFALVALLQSLVAQTREESIQILLEQTQKVPSKANILQLAKEIADNRRHESLLTTKAVANTNRASLALCNIPGYARHFADEIESEREKIQALPLKDARRNPYNRKRFEILRLILVELPGPESVAVLGRYLYDERDPMPPPSPAQDWNDPEPNSEIASDALAHIGLRNHPVTKEDFMNVDAVVRNRAWWEEVKSGRKPFSFIGQTVEYRFKPDGTWEATPIANPPDDGAVGRPAGAAQRPKRRPESVMSETKAPSSSGPWPWILIATMVLLGVIIWLAMRSRNV
jgi:hypothetical protein